MSPVCASLVHCAPHCPALGRQLSQPQTFCCSRERGSSQDSRRVGVGVRIRIHRGMALWLSTPTFGLGALGVG